MLVAGIDEAGRGPLAGPVVAGAVILREDRAIPGLADSKSLSAAVRERLAGQIRAEAAAYGIGWADPAEIDVLDILQATLLAMRRAVLALALPAQRLLIDGNRAPSLAGLGPGLQARCIVRGDASVPLIGAASILAKTARDAYMERADALYPQYGFARHKGYPTAEHRRLLRRFGPCPLHRRSFAPVAAAAGEAR
ncbi:MAG: ribonuclease HII [Steroidobacteraceae bacterium]|nr:ribonuclease HII [Steroidobacteraceae bacterium]